jgi:hypothetical protein
MRTVNHTPYSLIITNACFIRIFFGAQIVKCGDVPNPHTFKTGRDSRLHPSVGNAVLY